MNSLRSRLYWPKRKPISRPPTPMSPAGTSVFGPMWRNSSVMKLWQNFMTSLSLLPFGSKSDPPLPPPIGSVVREFLNTCSKARNFRMPRLTDGWKPQAALVGADGAVHLDAEAAIDLDVALVVQPRNAEHDDALGLDDPLDDPRLAVLGPPLQHQVERLQDLGDGLMELRLGRVLRLDLGQQVLRVARQVGFASFTTTMTRPP